MKYMRVGDMMGILRQCGCVNLERYKLIASAGQPAVEKSLKHSSSSQVKALLPYRDPYASPYIVASHRHHQFFPTK